MIKPTVMLMDELKEAVICRSWKNSVKGRDLYGYVFYLSRGTAVNLVHLTARLAQSGYITAEKQITIEDVKEMLLT